jgi:hypothetical protein
VRWRRPATSVCGPFVRVSWGPRFTRWCCELAILRSHFAARNGGKTGIRGLRGFAEAENVIRDQLRQANAVGGMVRNRQDDGRFAVEFGHDEEARRLGPPRRRVQGPVGSRVGYRAETIGALPVAHLPARTPRPSHPTRADALLNGNDLYRDGQHRGSRERRLQKHPRCRAGSPPT